MLIVGIAKLKRKSDGASMYKVDCLQDYGPDDSSRLEVAVGAHAETFWLSGEFMNKLSPDSVGKDFKPLYEYRNGRPCLCDIVVK